MRNRIYTTISSYIVRELRCDDYHRGFLELLGHLTEVGEVSCEQFTHHFLSSKNLADIYVLIDPSKDKIIASGGLLIESKFIHQCKSVGHIEDVVVDPNYRGQGLGKRIIEHLIQVGQKKDCYKIILNCKESNIGFYEKCGFKRREVEMVKYLKSCL